MRFKASSHVFFPKPSLEFLYPKRHEDKILAPFTARKQLWILFSKLFHDEILSSFTIKGPWIPFSQMTWRRNSCFIHCKETALNSFFQMILRQNSCFIYCNEDRKEDTISLWTWLAWNPFKFLADTLWIIYLNKISWQLHLKLM